MRRATLVGWVVLAVSPGCGRPDEPARSAPAVPAVPTAAAVFAEPGATALTVALGTPARFPVAGTKGRLFVEALATESVDGTAPGKSRSVRGTVRLCRADGADAALLTGAQAAAAVKGAPAAAANASNWTGPLSDDAPTVVGFRRCEVEPGVSANFDQLNASVSAHGVDALHVTFDARIQIVECVR